MSAKHSIRAMVRFYQCAIFFVFFMAQAALAADSSAISGDVTATLSTDVSSFGFEQVIEKARDTAAADYIPPLPLPKALKSLSYDQWRNIRFRPEASLWRQEGLPFEIQFFHAGFYYDRAIIFNVVDKNKVTPINFSPLMFNYEGESSSQESVFSEAESELPAFAGFRIHYPLNNPDYKDEIAAFLGASYFRAVGHNTKYGLSSRGVALNTALPSGEEFPWFREFWVVKPVKGDVNITLYALLDSPSCSGAYKFVIVPGTDTITKEEFQLFFRKPMEKVGLAALTSMYFYGETENGRDGDYRPEVHDSDGLLIREGENKWSWRQIRNGQRLGITSFKVENFKGFGLLQRDRNFDHYQDLEADYDERPSLWVEAPDWRNGFIELIEIPTDTEYNDNVVAFWVPEITDWSVPFTGSCTLYWGRQEERLHSLGRVVATRRAQGDQKNWIRFIVDFEGGELDSLPHDAGLMSVLDVKGAELVQKHLEKNNRTGGWRLSFQIAQEEKQGFSVFPAEPRTVKMTSYLQKGENFPEPLTEIWTYEISL